MSIFATRMTAQACAPVKISCLDSVYRTVFKVGEGRFSKAKDAVRNLVASTPNLYESYERINALWKTLWKNGGMCHQRVIVPS